MKSEKLQNLLSPVTIIVLATIMRLLPHPANVAPIAAMALFGGVYLNRKSALVMPLIALFVSDIFLGFHATMPFVYGSFLLIGLVGLWLRKHKQAGFVIAGSLFSSLLFFLITNGGVWLIGDMYPHTVSGLIDCFVMAIPFFRNTIFGDLLYVGIFFGSFEVIHRLLSRGTKVLNQAKNA